MHLERGQQSLQLQHHAGPLLSGHDLGDSFCKRLSLLLEPKREVLGQSLLALGQHEA